MSFTQLKYVGNDTIYIKDIVKDLFLIDFEERKNNSCEIVGISDVLHWNSVFDNRDVSFDIGSIGDASSAIVLDDLEYNTFFAIKERYSAIYQCLLLCNGNLSICGIDVITLVTGSSANRINLFFDSCTVVEATNYFSKCYDILLEKYTILFGTDYVLLTDENNTIFIYFRIFENKNMLLRNIGDIGERHGWNPKDGYFTTISGGMSIAMKGFPIDIRFPLNRIHICEDAGYNLLLHGLEENFHDGVLEIHPHKIIYNILNKPHSIIDVDKYNAVITSLESLSSTCELPNFSYFKENTQHTFNLQDYFGKEYKVYITGIHNDRYVAFANCKRKFNLNDDIFRLLCNYWLSIEAYDAKQALNNISDDNPVPEHPRITKEFIKILVVPAATNLYNYRNTPYFTEEFKKLPISYIRIPLPSLKQFVTQISCILINARKHYVVTPWTVELNKEITKLVDFLGPILIELPIIVVKKDGRRFEHSCSEELVLGILLGLNGSTDITLYLKYVPDIPLLLEHLIYNFTSGPRKLYILIYRTPDSSIILTFNTISLIQGIITGATWIGKDYRPLIKNIFINTPEGYKEVRL